MNEIESELAKAAGTVATDVAEDLVRPTSKSVGDNLGLMVDGVMGWLGYWGKKQQIKREIYLENYKKQISKKVAAIPEDKLIEPPMRIVGPAIEASKYFIEETTCRDMFAQLIASACNSDISNAVHPSFPEIIKQLSPLDARFLLLFKKRKTFPAAQLTERDSHNKLTPYHSILFDFMDIPNDFTSSDQIELSKSVDNLIRFGLMVKNREVIELDYDYNKFKHHWIYTGVQKTISEGSKIELHRYRLELTLLGQDFVKSCIPNEN